MRACAEARRDGAKRRPAMRDRARRRGASHERACGVPVRAHFFFLFASCRGCLIFCSCKSVECTPCTYLVPRRPSARSASSTPSARSDGSTRPRGASRGFRRIMMYRWSIGFGNTPAAHGSRLAMSNRYPVSLASRARRARARLPGDVPSFALVTATLTMHVRDALATRD